MTRHRWLVGLVSGVLMAGLMSVPTTLAQGPTDAGEPVTELEPSPVPSPAPSPSPSPIPSPSPSPIPSPSPSPIPSPSPSAGAPPNDDPSSPAIIGSLPFSDTPDLTGATSAGEPAGGYCGELTNTVWYSFTPALAQDIRFDLAGAATDIRMEIWQGDVVIGCVEGGSVGGLEAWARVTYVLRIGTIGVPGVVPFTIERIGDPYPPPANDDFASATPVGALPFEDFVEFRGASIEPGEPVRCEPFNRSTWYALTIDADLKLRMTAQGDGWVMVYRDSWDTYTGFCAYVWSSRNITLSGGHTYYFQLATNWYTGAGGIRLEEIEAPPNDDPEDAVAIPSLPWLATPSFTGATTQEGEPPPCRPDEDRVDGESVWYSYAPAIDETLMIRRTSGDFGVTVFLDDRTTEVGCLGRWEVRATFSASAGRSYLLQVTAGHQDSGTFEVAIAPPPPPNDALADATVIAELPFETLDAQLLGATRGPEDDVGYCYYPQQTIWYVLVPAEEVNLDVSVLGDWDVTVQTYREVGERLDLVDCQRAGDAAHRIRATAGERIYLQLGSDHSESGGIRVELGPPPLRVDVSIDPIGSRIKAGGGVAVSGTITCTREAESWLSVEVRQAVGRKLIVVGQASRYLTCTPEGAPWTIFVFSDNGAYGGGSALVTVHSEAWAPAEWTTSETTGVIGIRGQIRL